MAPDEVHLVVNGTKRESSFEDQENATGKKKARTDQSNNHRDQVVTRGSAEGHDTNRHTGSDKHAQAQIERHHASLQYARTAGEFVELLKDQGLTFEGQLASVVSFCHGLKTFR